MTGAPTLGPWVVVSDYPTWPSPYFRHLERYVPTEVDLSFAPDLDALVRHPPGVVNLHRLKRLYRQPDGARTVQAAEVLLERLRVLRENGWRLVWTVHNLLPIDGGRPDEADLRAAHGVLEQADAVVTHTHADAAHLRALTHAPVRVAGWAGLTADARQDTSPQVVELANQMRGAPFSILVLGNLTAYKDLPAAVRAFTAATDAAHLFVVGPSRQAGLPETLSDMAGRSRGRVHLRLDRVPPQDVHVLYRAADAALCPYRVDGQWAYFTQVLHPSSIGTAVAFNTPVVAPDLPAIREMTCGHPARLYRPSDGPGSALAAAEQDAAWRAPRPCTDGAARWEAIGAAYAELSRFLRQPDRSSPKG